MPIEVLSRMREHGQRKAVCMLFATVMEKGGQVHVGICLEMSVFPLENMQDNWGLHSRADKLREVT